MRSIAIRSKRERQILELLYPERDYWRPKTRADCEKVDRPCPYVACRYNLYTDIGSQGISLCVNFPDHEPHEMEHSCALDLAEPPSQTVYETGYHMTLDDIGEILGITRERVRQIQDAALTKIRSSSPDFAYRGPPPRWQRVVRGAKKAMG